MTLRIPFALAAAALALAACSTADVAPPPNTLIAARSATPPPMTADAASPVWQAARPLIVKTEGGANFGKDGGSTATLKAVVSGDMIYFLLQYADPTYSVQRGPFQKQADGSWKQLTDPANKGGDDNVYYEDKWSFIWNTAANPIKGFDTQGCAVLCHLGAGKPFGNKYTAGPGQIGDMWHMKGSRNGVFGQVDDQYVDWTQYEGGKNPNAGRKGDPGGPDYRAFKLVNGKPEFMNKDGKAANAGGTYWIKDGEQVAFVDSFKPGDEVASYIVNRLQGDRADLRVSYRWVNGVYTYEIARKLVTGSPYDVQFDNLGRSYTFGLALFDNAQVRHAVSFDVLNLRFAQ